MRWVREYSPHPERRRLYRQALVVTVIGNLLLAAGKGLVAYLTGSVAVYADAANSLSDVLYSFLMVLGLTVAQRPPDISHPQGHSRFEPLVGLSVALAMALAGIQAVRVSLERFQAGGLAIEAGLPTLVLLASAAIKLGMFYYIRRVGRAVSSQVLQTTALDNLSDVLTSLAAFIGAWGSRLVNPLFDPLAGFLVAAWIFRTAFLTGRENLNFLTGRGASSELQQRILRLALSVPGVLNVNQMMTDYAGPRLVVDLHVNVNGNSPLYETHAISDELIRRLEELPEVDRAYVHVEPHDWVD
jgi:cation diffusion facilitator family transporter